ncbi:hypothetical protein DO021_04915 [Desulfobacter hydrogenophilus]|uniref:Uncharacterized protein n=1 Tax=Desulfobacter hydrogenophilus TaxID=2291 RepID=A0A328FJ54_9BACT|nr:hypothetical protein [Desulfobacter hydrogenophilus]NDY70887.1 hypothetical protein [Desulfobacter hydrogenophilus]QBH11657.1 hypothetical protein EYB58_01180 [Desulfobacter hydrogenophilus]RAM03203.1 hypothetical protein DO021_04915 [Desulfobacter hydrogenophilus]
MINFYFFPFTYMDARQANILSCFFNYFNVLDIHDGAVLPEPMAGLEAQGQLGRVCLDKEKLAIAEQGVRAYMAWAAIHKGNERNLRALIRENTFFKDDSGVAAICAGIRKGTVLNDPDATISRDSSDSLVFLKFADIHDRQSQDIQSALDTLDQENAALLAELKGDGDMSLSVDHTQSPEPGQAMTEKRIKAWLKAAVDAECFDPRGIPVLITTSRAVMDEFLTGAGQAINALDIDSIKVHEKDREVIKQQHFKIKGIIERMAQGLTPDSEKDYFEGADHGSVTGRIQIRFFSGLGDVALTKKNPGGQIGVCLVELNS